MAAGDYFEITLPAGVSIASGAITSTCSEIFAGVSVSCEGTGQVLKLTIGTSFNAFTTLRFQVGAFTNPGSTEPTAVFSAASYISGGPIENS